MSNSPSLRRPRSRINGATQTFRRPSLATNPSSTREGAQNAPPTSSANTGVYIPPHLNSNSSSAYLRNGVSGESRYNKDHMMDIYRSQRDSGALDRNLGQLFLGDWSPYEQKDGGGSTWGKRDEGKDLNSGPEVCWNHEVDEDPLGLVGMSGEEQEVSQVPQTFCLQKLAYVTTALLNVGKLTLETPTEYRKRWKCERDWQRPQNINFCSSWPFQFQHTHFRETWTSTSRHKRFFQRKWPTVADRQHEVFW